MILGHEVYIHVLSYIYMASQIIFFYSTPMKVLKSHLIFTIPNLMKMVLNVKKIKNKKIMKTVLKTIPYWS